MPAKKLSPNKIKLILVLVILLGAAAAAAKSGKLFAKKENVSKAGESSNSPEKKSPGGNPDDSQGKNDELPGVELSSAKNDPYPVHKNVSTTYFWAGEDASDDNGHISNSPSAWDDDWVKHYGGMDDPKNRNGYEPAKFTPKENPFYFALPYNDFAGNGKRKKNAFQLAAWADPKEFSADQSVCKNQWIRIIKGGKTAYAQWEDVGPFGEDDVSYVFGSGAPKSKENSHAGLDVSPAVKDYLGLSDVDQTDWQFVSASDVPDGPWKKTVTTSQTSWN